MTRPLTGLTGLAGYQTQIDADSQASPEDRMGGVADPSHSKYLAEDYIRRGAQIGEPIGPYGPDNQMLGDELWFMEPGGHPADDPQFDHTPNTHAGPWLAAGGPVPGNDPDSVAIKLSALAKLHAMDTNADAQIVLSRQEALNDTWETIDQLNPGNSDQREVPDQMKSAGFGWGTRDRVQSFAPQNEFGFDSTHQHRRWATGGIPGNTMWLKPGGRPMVKSLPGPARPAIGPDSPFAGQDLGRAFDVNGAILQNLPNEYEAPPQPALAEAAVSVDNNSFPEWY